MSDLDSGSNTPPLDEKKNNAQHLEFVPPQLDSKGKKVHLETVFNAEFAAATKAEVLPKWSRESIILYLCCGVSFLCAIANGYDGSLLTSVLAMPHFRKTMGTATTGPTVSLIASIYTVGQIIGAGFAGMVADKFGRRKGMFTGAVVIIIGSVITATANRVPQLVVGRFILGAGISMMTVSAPSYCVEVSPPAWRGRMVGIYNCGWFGGSVPAAAVCFGTQYIDGNASWRIPIVLQCFAAGIVCVAVWFIPESPRWLLANGREEEAHAFLVRFHGQKKPDSKVVALEWAEFKANISQTGSDKRPFDFTALFNTHNARWRMGMVLCMSVFGQFSGNGLGYFNTVIYNNLGYTSVAVQLALNLATQVASAIGAFSGAFLSDRMPRRPTLILGTFASAGFLLINGLLGWAWGAQANTVLGDGTIVYDNPNLKLGQGAIASYVLFNVVFSFAYTPLQAGYPAECLESTTRAKGMGLSGAISACMGLINQCAGPIALQNIGNNYVFVFVGWDTIEALIWWAFCVETQGRTLEQLDVIFDAPNPVKASKETHQIAVSDEDNHDVRVIEQI